MYKVAVLNQQKVLRIRPKLLGKLVDLVLDGESKDTELSLRFVDDKVIAKLNGKYLHRGEATDVLAFPMREGSFSRLHPELLGDVVVSTQRALRAAQKYKTSIPEELCRYVVHGILHLLGYDDITRASRKRMESKQEKLLAEALTYYGKDFFSRTVALNNRPGKKG